MAAFLEPPEGRKTQGAIVRRHARKTFVKAARKNSLGNRRELRGMETAKHGILEFQEAVSVLSHYISTNVIILERETKQGLPFDGTLCTSLLPPPSNSVRADHRQQAKNATARL